MGTCLWTPTVPAWAPIRPSLPGRARTLAAEPEAAGVLRPLRMVVWVTEGGRRLTERAQSGHGSERRKWAGVETQPGAEAGATLGEGASADPLWSLVRQAQGPFSREGRGCGLKGSRGAGGCWPCAGQGQGRFLGTGNQAAGVVRGGWEGTRPQQDSISGPPPPLPPLAWGCHRVKALSKTTETQRAGDQLGPTKLQSQQSPRFWPWGSG